MARTPNVLLLLTDQERRRAWFPDEVRFPTRERLAAEGLTFRRCYSAASLCTPSRATILTGRHAPTVGMGDNVDVPWQASLDPAVPTLGTMLGDAGYHAAYLGKWHLSRGADLRDSLEPHGFADWIGPDRHGRPYEGRFYDGQTASQAARWLREKAPRDRPWFLAVSIVNPHDIMFSPRAPRLGLHDYRPALPPSFGDDLSTKPTIQRAFRSLGHVVGGFVGHTPVGRLRLHGFVNDYIDLHHESDRHLGSVLDALDETGLADDTVVVLTSDHGELAAAHQLRGKGPVIYEENSNVPLVVRWPGVTPAGWETEAMASLVDLAPTVLSLAGAPEVAARHGLPGVDLSPVLRDPVTAVRDAVLLTYDARSTLGKPGDHARGFLRGVVQGSAKLARYFEAGDERAPMHRQELEAYDLLDDRPELVNLAYGGGARSALVGDLLDRLADLEARELGS